MMLALLVAGIGFLLAGLVAIAFGIPVNEFSFGNTLIVAGTTAACCGAILLGLWIVARELKNIARRLGAGAMDETRAVTPGATASSVSDDDGFLLSHDQAAAGSAEPDAQSSAPSAVPWQEEAAARNRAAEPAPAVKPRRNLLFSSSSRKERERAEVRVTDPSVPDLRPAPPPETNEAPQVTFDDAWPQSERPRAAPPQRSSSRPPPAPAEANPVPARPDRRPPVMRSEDPAPVTILKSGVVDGMAYSLYSDGSIEAQMPEGMMRFGSIDELRSHLDQRP